MRRSYLGSTLLLVLLAAVQAQAQQQLVITPTTTLAKETSNNTSASTLFNDTYNTKYGSNTTNGDAAAGNWSKLSIRSLLYSGSTTKIFAHTQSWFCHDPANVVNGTLSPNATCGGHIDIGYTSGSTTANPTEEHLQEQDMLSRGIQGAVVNWYNNTKSNAAVQNFKAEAENSSGQFVFGVNIDKGAFGTDCQSACTVTSSGLSCPTTPVAACTSEATSLVSTVMSNYAGSAAYMKTGSGQPIIFFFIDTGTNPRPEMIDWAQVRASAGGNSVFVFDNSQGFTVTDSAGAYA